MKSFEERLAAESSAWVGEGLLSAEQRAALLARHPVAAPASGHRFIAILALIGGGLLAAGVALLIAAHWERIGDWIKIGALVALLVGANVAGWRCRIAPGRYPKVGEACFLLGAVLFLLGIALVSQIYHLDRRPADGVLIWWLGIAVLPWLTRAKGAGLAALAALLVWLGMEFAAEDSWLRLADGAPSGRAGFFPAAFFLAGVALHLSGAALRGGRRPEFAGLHEQTGLLLACAALYAQSFQWSRWASDFSDAKPRLFPFALLGLFLVVSVLWAGRRRAAEVRRLALWSGVGLAAVAGELVIGNAHGAAWLWGAAACVGLFLLNVGMIRSGLAAGRESGINLGLAFIALNILTRYFDLFGTMLEGGVFFVVSGGIVLGLGFYLERKRRKLVSAMPREVA